MTDVHEKAIRSFNMSRIRSKNTRPELLLRKRLWAEGLRYRIEPDLPGKPDIYISRQEIAVFVDGCFWHMCPAHFQFPKTRPDFWRNKLKRNVARDAVVNLALKNMGVRVFRFWEHQVKDELEDVVGEIRGAIH
ncbi:MAG: DNA mismatch endonuclease Vsr [Acidobacteria bacterium]|nr:MAG: DNA mismatch endonuclease Vsr [Acidobacteriota bacterium]REJ98183.1 MAG: DNA mismatch endonuclease Vsr [Acidobacteriota bacterium]REK16926.1 MAG: DNA mismatch endonuclease Vsr [Acidobacteriota bacterium]REK42837.1 MAG: DNA mismatch endonuclease Vsr [Acidobacteriota bacterium]